MSESKTRDDALPDEIQHVTAIHGHFVELDPVGTLGAVMIRADLDSATRTIASGHIVQHGASLARDIPRLTDAHKPETITHP